eukprot:TRINITY_DN46359_c0_g1_i1.p1 TRINITY_DN46359_c0_g1~~TRINITY_DN46359_c0_g1_i1.p1  ORF type:complete len:209 (+),score=31.41 TRINITY_DN46359_c0_g1_i1:143-769(+)
MAYTALPAFPSEHDQDGLKSGSLQVTFKNISFSVAGIGKGSEEKTILKGLDGVFESGRLTAILGASGSGKTSLLNLIAGQLSMLPESSQIGGEVLVNGQTHQLGDDFLSQISGYVQQDDIILDTMTVREAITMSALLRLPTEMPQDQKLDRVSKVISLLRLEKCAESVVGSQLVKGISGGERRRVSIAKIGRAVQQECRDRSRMPSSA